MRCLLLLFSCSLFTAARSQQKPFEGKIVYTLHATGEKEDAELTAYFGKNALRLEFKTPADKRKSNTEYLLVRLDSGTVYTVLPTDSNYRISVLRKQVPLSPVPGKIIAGFKTTPVTTGSELANSAVTGFLGSGVLYTADDLYFPVPDEYKGNAELMLVRNNRVVLGADFNLAGDERSYREANDTVAPAPNQLTATALSVSQQPQDPSLFRVPAGFVPYRYDYSADSIAAASDTAYTITTVPADEPAPKKKSTAKKKTGPAAPKKKTTIKQNAVKRKEE